MKNIARINTCHLLLLLYATFLSRVALVRANPNVTKIFFTPVHADDSGPVNVVGEDVGSIATAPRWSQVRAHLDGFWFNGAGTPVENLRRIVMRCAKDELQLIIPTSFRVDETTGRLTDNFPAWNKYLATQEALSSTQKVLHPIGISFDSITVIEGKVNLHEAIAVIEKAKTEPLYGNVSVGIAISPRHGLDRPSQGVGSYLWRLRRLLNSVNGYVTIEMAPWRLVGLPQAREGFLQIYREAEARGLPFGWIMNRGVGQTQERWISDMNAALTIFANNEVYPAFIAASNQGDESIPQFPFFPEIDEAGSPANTIMGGIYNLQHQLQGLH